MKYQIAGWAGTGLLVAGCWALYFLGANQDSPTKPILYALVRLSCPIALIRSYPLSVYVVVVANAATYALIGVIVETLRRQLESAG